ncbi:MAG: homoserine dehydrogenase [Fibrobacter sp.]|nr:homoserine dehydrogenase [Fibrobacter sp.]
MRIGIVGVGTVGSGVIEIIEERQELWKNQGINLEIVALAAKSMDELVGFEGKDYKLCTDVNEIIADPSIDVFVELVGGYELPKQWIKTALENGKHVVTANKALIAKHGAELFPLAKEKSLQILFEAAVGGGIPIIRTLQEGMTGNTVEHLSCIINGTCNYILSRMTREGISYPDVLAEAQKLGYAEADPTFDVEGIDSAHKLAILASLSSGTFVDFEKIHVSGISQISATDIEFAQEFGCVIKLLGIYSRQGDRVDARVHACFVPEDHLLASINGVLNGVYLEGDNLGPALQTGAGAGKLPTASAVVADLAFLARSQNRIPIPMDCFNENNTADLVPINELKTRYYFRFTTKDARGVLASITSILSKNEISIESIVQKNVKDPHKVSVVVITEKVLESNVAQALREIDALEAVTEPSRTIRFL